VRILPGLVILVLLSLTGASAFAVTKMQKQSAQKILAKFISERRAPGLQYIIVDANKVLYQYQGGLADIRQQIPVTAGTTFHGYSITKTFTAAAVVRLALENHIDLDRPIAGYIKDLAIENGPTVRQTLQHTGGFANPNPLAWIHRADRLAQFDETAFIRDIITNYPGLKYRPGEKLAYSNVGYVVLGELVRQVSGMPYDEYVSTQLIRPLALREDQVISFSIDRLEQHATGYIRKWYWLNLALGFFIDRDEYLAESVDGWIPFKPFLVNGKAYGGIIGNASGLARYLQAILKREAPFSQAMLDLMWKTGVTSEGKSIPRGLGWFHGVLNGEHYYMHTGGGGGYYCEIRIYPDAKRASVIMTNNTGISAQHYLDMIDPVFLSDKRGTS